MQGKQWCRCSEQQPQRQGQKQSWQHFPPVYLQQFSRKKILTGAHISNTATAWQRLSFRWHSLKMHVCTTKWGTTRDDQDLTDTIFTSWQVRVQYQEKRQESVQGASINHAQRAAVVCMQDIYISSYQRCRNPNATFHSLQRTGKYLNKNLGCKDSTSTAQRDNKLYSQYREDMEHMKRRESLFTTIRYSKIQPQMK